jgi:hypothetical protein
MGDVKYKRVIAILRGNNPYPEDIFTPLTSNEIKEYVKLITSNKKSSDRFAAHLMRLSWDNCVDELEKIIKEDED